MTERGKKIRDAFLAKYGVAHPSQLPEVKKRIREKRLSGAYDGMVEKMRQTKLEKYGDPNYGNVEKGRNTKREMYGDPNYNNREKMVQTNLDRYGSKVSPKTREATKRRIAEKEIGFGSEKYKTFLMENKITNISQMTSVKMQKSAKQIELAYFNIVNGDRLRGKVIPLFSLVDYRGTAYNAKYPFRCTTCNSEFFDHVYSGHIPRCPTCYPHNKFESVGQSEVAKFVSDMGFQVESNNRAILNGQEIDIYIPEKCIGIEFDGVFWHSELSGNKGKSYHLKKTEECSRLGIDLIHILDQEWNEKKDIVKNIIATKLGKINRKIYARQCEIMEIDAVDCGKFLDANHIKGDSVATIRLGIKLKDELISVMTFCESRFDKTYQYEISRYCTLLGTQLIGGASKLLAYFIKQINPKSIVSYSDRRFFVGKMYSAIGMRFESNTPPAFHYTMNGSIVGNRLTFRKHKLKTILSTFDTTKSEWENMKSGGFDRIWDCGNSKHVWTSIDNVIVSTITDDNQLVT